MTAVARKRPKTDAAAEIPGVLRERSLTTERPTDGRVVSIRLIEGSDGLYCAVLRVSWRTGTYLLCQRDTDEVKRYSNISAFIQRCRKTYRFDGPIVVETEKGSSQ